jgi:hypothetical protein
MLCSRAARIVKPEELLMINGGEDTDSMYPLLAELSPEDWEDASTYEDAPST